MIGNEGEEGILERGAGMRGFKVKVNYFLIFFKVGFEVLKFKVFCIF